MGTRHEGLWRLALTVNVSWRRRARPARRRVDVVTMCAKQRPKSTSLLAGRCTGRTDSIATGVVRVLVRLVALLDAGPGLIAYMVIR